jgi:hypothetical protein
MRNEATTPPNERLLSSTSPTGLYTSVSADLPPSSPAGELDELTELVLMAIVGEALGYTTQTIERHTSEALPPLTPYLVTHR